RSLPHQAADGDLHVPRLRDGRLPARPVRGAPQRAPGRRRAEGLQGVGMTPEAVVFYVLASIALVSAVMVIWSRSVIHSAIYLVLTFFCVAAVYILLRAEFVAVVQVLVYA